MRIVFVTQPSHPAMEDDDRPLAASLEARGARVAEASWDDAAFDWSSCDVALLRSPWDYYRRAEEFFAWLARVEGKTRILNPPDVVRWNANKKYMVELAARGAHVTPTVIVERGASVDLAAVASARGWGRVVLKPAVSADSWETVRVDLSNAEDRARADAYLARHRSGRDVLIQPFIESVDAVDGGRGERCLVFFGGEFSHAVTKNSCFLGGRHVGAEGRSVTPADDEIAAAREILRIARAQTLPYARVDLARGGDGRPLLLELELFEPTLFFECAPGSAPALARLIERAAREGRAET
jgi:O-ureido-D-serine cyclo-ligase